MKEELPIGSKIGEVQAIDEDEGDNAVIDYAIIGKRAFINDITQVGGGVLSTSLTLYTVVYNMAVLGSRRRRG